MGTLLRSASIPLPDPRQYFHEAERSLTGPPIPFSYVWPELFVSSVGASHMRFARRTSRERVNRRKQISDCLECVSHRPRTALQLGFTEEACRDNVLQCLLLLFSLHFAKNLPFLLLGWWTAWRGGAQLR